MEKTKEILKPCSRCNSRDVRFRLRIKPHHLCRRCGKSWDEPGDELLD